MKKVSSKDMIDEQTWVANSQIVRRFVEQLPNYEDLCQEVSFILEYIIKESSIEYSSITARAKTLKSFIEKIDRKKYDDPFKKIEDFAGVRLVFYFKSDFKKIETLIRQNFTKVKLEDKLEDKGVDKFGYNAKHFVVQLSKKHAGARHKNLLKMNCEIQIRTVFQDAWAVIDHHVVYKNETVVSKKIQRELNCISATLETADNNLVTIKNTRRANLQRIDKLKNNTSKFLKSKLTIDTFSKYLDWKYEELYRELWSGQMAFVFNIIQDKLKIKTLQELDMIVDRNKNKFNKVAAKLKGTKSFKSSSVAVALSLAIEYPKGLSNKDIPNEWIDVLNKLD